MVDSHPLPNPNVVGKGYIRERWQTWDSTFGLSSHSVTLHAYKGNKLYARTYTAPAVQAFFDSGPNAYWDSRVPYNSVQTPGSGLRVDILSVASDGMTYQVRVH